MATTPIEDEPQPTVTRRVAQAITTPLVERNSRQAALLALAAAAAATAPVPLGPIAAGIIVIVASERRR